MSLYKNTQIQDGQEVYIDRGGEHLLNWLSYWVAVEAINKLKPGNILEIGVGRGVVSNYLKHIGYRVTSCDYDIRLAPDCVANILALPFRDNAFDSIICCEVLEHLPFENSLKALREINRVTKKYAIISIPYNSLSLSFLLSFFPVKFIEPLFKLLGLGASGPFGISIKIPNCFSKKVLCENHYWEMGLAGFSKKIIKNNIQKSGFRVIDEKANKLFSYHYFFILEKI